MVISSQFLSVRNTCFSDQAVIPIKSQILMPMDGKEIPSGNYVIGGIAFAGRYGIRKLQVLLIMAEPGRIPR